MPIHDKLQFFVGDHPAQSFERGSQIGGNYRCGSCGYKSNRGEDLGHVFSLQWRSLVDLQKLVILGKFGNSPGVLKPFVNLSKEQLVQELRIRNVFDLTGNKAALMSRLQRELCGAQRVPTILINSPSQSLSEINLDGYTVLDCEPLHDLKGHLINLLPEIPHVLAGDNKRLVTELLQTLLLAKKQNGYSGSDLRICLIELDCLVQSLDVREEVKLLLRTAVQISKILYSSDDKRSPKTILQLYNCTWLHHELCKSLFPTPKEISYEKLFGLYLHSLAVHAPRQYEIVCLRSVNTENQERLFQQAKQIASRCTNRKPDNVITEVLVRIQAKNISGSLSSVYKSAKSRVDTHASKSCPFQRTKIGTEFVASRPHSWQAHLKRISRFLLKGKVWWDSTDDEFFFDGDEHENVRPEGPIMFHFRSSSLHETEMVSAETWKVIVENEIELPCLSLRIYDDDGDLLSVRDTGNQTNTNACDEDHFDNSSGNSSTPLNILVTPSSTSNIVSDSPPQTNPLVTSTPLSSVKSLQEKSNVTTPIRNVNAKRKRPVITSCTNDATNMVAGPEDNYEITSESNVACSVSHSLVSKSANAIAYIIGFSPELAKFDMLHVKCKSSSLVSRADRDAYKSVLASLQTKVLQQKKSLTADMKEYEKQCFSNNHELPSSNDQTYSDLRRKIKHIKALLRSWSIKF